MADSTKVCPLLSYISLQILKGHYQVSLEALPLQAENLISLSLSSHRVFVPSPGAFLWPSSGCIPTLVLRTLQPVLQVRSHQCKVEEQDCLPRPAGHSSSNAAQEDWDTWDSVLKSKEVQDGWIFLKKEV